jgi:hypothetical protein
MKIAFNILLYLLLLSLPLLGQSDPYADSVTVFNKGVGSWANQEAPYFPANVLGPPTPSATNIVPATSPYDICSLGIGGEIILKFTDNAIVNQPGDDFTVFENPFLIQFGPRAGQVFAEPGKVAVSKDGINFYEFPFDSLSLIGCAGLTPTNGSKDPTNPDSSGGDHFDLATVGLDTAYYVKITDVTQIILSDTSHPYYDFTANGFDLDAIAAIHSADIITDVEHFDSSDLNYKNSVTVFPNPASKSANSNIKFEIRNKLMGKIVLSVYNLLGQKVTEKIFRSNSNNYSRIKLSLSRLSAGVYFSILRSGNKIYNKKFIILH